MAKGIDVVAKTSAHSGWLAAGFNHCSEPLSAGLKPKPAGVASERVREEVPVGARPNSSRYS